MEDDDSDCDHSTCDSRASGNEDSDFDSESKVEMTDAEDPELEEAFEGFLKRPFSIGVARTLLCAQFRAAEGSTRIYTPMLAPDAWLSSHVYGRYRNQVYVDGHESEDRNEIFLPIARIGCYGNLCTRHRKPGSKSHIPTPIGVVYCTHKVLGNVTYLRALLALMT